MSRWKIFSENSASYTWARHVSLATSVLLFGLFLDSTLDVKLLIPLIASVFAFVTCEAILLQRLKVTYVNHDKKIYEGIISILPYAVVGQFAEWDFEHPFPRIILNPFNIYLEIQDSNPTERFQNKDLDILKRDFDTKANHFIRFVSHNTSPFDKNLYLQTVQSEWKRSKDQEERTLYEKEVKELAESSNKMAESYRKLIAKAKMELFAD